MVDRQKLEVTQPGEPKCFCCLGTLDTSMGGVDPWEGPGGAVCFMDQGNFGSRLYDSCYSGDRVELMICDECLEDRDHLLRKYVTPGHAEARDERSAEAVMGMDMVEFRRDSDERYKKWEAVKARAIADPKCLTAEELDDIVGSFGDDWQTEILKTSEQRQEESMQRWREEIVKIKAIHKARILANAKKLIMEAGCTVLDPP